APLARPRDTPAHEVARVERAGNQARAMERVADGPGAVISAVLEAAVTAAVAIRLAGDLVRGIDGELHRLRSSGRRNRRSPVSRYFCHRARHGWERRARLRTAARATGCRCRGRRQRYSTAL